jgi:hypothetical protein
VFEKTSNVLITHVESIIACEEAAWYNIRRQTRRKDA